MIYNRLIDYKSMNLQFYPALVNSANINLVTSKFKFNKLFLITIKCKKVICRSSHETTVVSFVLLVLVVKTVIYTNHCVTLPYWSNHYTRISYLLHNTVFESKTVIRIPYGTINIKILKYFLLIQRKAAASSFFILFNACCYCWFLY